jgi:hypothetical protein
MKSTITVCFEPFGRELNLRTIRECRPVEPKLVWSLIAMLSQHIQYILTHQYEFIVFSKATKKKVKTHCTRLLYFIP